MTGVFRRRRRRWLVGLTGALCVLSALLVLPAVATACPKWSKIKGFRGDADTSFDGTVSGSDNNGGTVTVGLDRAGSVKIDLAGRIPKSGNTFTEFLGGTGGGILRVDDTYTDIIDGAVQAAGKQTADGPGVTHNLSDLAFLVLNPTTCTYQLHIAFAVLTTSTGDWPTTPDPGAGGFAITPRRPIPASLKLVGSADVPAFYENCSGSNPVGGCYEFAGLDGGYQWAQEFDMLKTCGSVVASSCGPEGQEGTAHYEWSIKPSTSKTKHHKKKKKKKKKHGQGLRQSAARRGRVSRSGVTAATAPATAG